MIKLYTAPTPNGRKVSIALEELELPYEVIRLKLDEQETHTAPFKARNPNAKIPVIDDDGQVIWESGAILYHLATRPGSGDRLLPGDAAGRSEVMTCMFFQAAHVGPNLGRLGEQFFKPEAERNAEMTDLFLNESLRVFGVLDTMLGDGRENLAGAYSIADIMVYPWLFSAREAASGFFDSLDNLRAWMDRTAARPAVVRGMAVPE